MKKLLFSTMVMVALLCFTSCGENSLPQNNDSMESLNKALDTMVSVNSMYYTSNYEQIIKSDTDTITTTNTARIKRINDPFVIWSKVENTSSHTNTQETRTIIESYQKATADGVELFYRGDHPLTDWQKSTIEDKTRAKQYIDSSKDFMKAEHDLLNANADTFKRSGKQDGFIKYSGTISQLSVIEVYKKYLRNFYVDAGLMKSDEKLSNNEMLKEITDGKILELTVGIPSLAFSDQPIPISVWVNEKNNTISKVEIDKINVIQALLELTFEESKEKVPKVERAILTYEIVEINAFDEIPMP